MGDRSKIEWTDATWNPTRGCSRVSEGCVNCYAEIMAARFSDPGLWGHGFAEIVRKASDPLWLDHRWTGKVKLVEDKLLEPLKWRKPRRIFVNSTSDLFHERLHDEDIDKVFAVMALCPQHTFQILTKRPERMREYMTERWAGPHGMKRSHLDSMVAARHISGRKDFEIKSWPLSNVWLGTSCEDQATADERIPHLLQTSAAIRFVSCEPLLGPIDLRRIPECDGVGVDWVIVGGESGKGARPMHPEWAFVIRDQCEAAGVAFFFKQWGEWAPDTGPAADSDPIFEGKGPCAKLSEGGWEFSENGFTMPLGGDGEWLYRLGKKPAGRLLDGREHNEYPEAR